MSNQRRFSWWQRTAIPKKLQLGIFSFSAITMAIAFITLNWAAEAYFHNKLQRELSTLAEVIAENSRASVTFKDEKSAKKTLSALEKKPNVEAAAIFSENKLFTKYQKKNTFNRPLNIDLDSGSMLMNEHYYAVAPIVVTDKTVGKLVLISNLSEWNLIQEKLYLLMIGLFFGLLVLTLIVSAGLRFYITRPLTTLSAWARKVTNEKSFSLLAEKTSDDEIGILVDSLNDMLTELSKQESIVQWNERLKHEIEERKKVEENLIEMRRAAEEASEAKTNFLANMSHEIRTPMNAIIGFVEIILETKLLPEQRKYLKTVKRSANVLHSLLNDILDVAKLEQGKLQIESVPFSLANVIEDIVESFGLSARNKGLMLNYSINESLADYVEGDPLRVNQVLINLVGNAIKFTHDGSVNISVEPFEGDRILFKVSDTGIGISSGKLEHIFQNFAQEDSSISRKYGGSGLGTTISKQLVELMGGEIWVESEPEKGSTFFFTINLPASAEAPHPQHTDSPRIQELVTDTPLNVLVAEDVDENFELVRVRLEASGHQVTHARNGIEAVNAVKEGEFDIILMDLQMPDMDGLTASHKIRELANGVNIPIIALTASVLRLNRLACEQAGMTGFVTKPIQFPRLFTEMARALELPIESMKLEDTSESHEVIGDIPGININKAMEIWRDKTAYVHSLHTFFDSFHNSPDNIRDALAIGDIIQARKIIHALKGASGNMCLPRLYDAAVDLSNSIKAQNQEATPTNLIQLSAAFEQVSSSVALLSENNDDAPQHVPGDDLPSKSGFRRMISDLVNAYSKGELAEQLQHRALAVFKAKGLPEQDIERLDKAVQEFEFEEASVLVQSLAREYEATL